MLAFSALVFTLKIVQVSDGFYCLRNLIVYGIVRAFLAGGIVLCYPFGFSGYWHITTLKKKCNVTNDIALTKRLL